MLGFVDLNEDKRMELVLKAQGLGSGPSSPFQKAGELVQVT